MLKEQAAVAAADLVRSGMRLGLGTGSTAALIVRELGRRLADGRLREIAGLPTSEATARIAAEVGVPLLDFTPDLRLDLTLDGADEVNPQWDLIKGAGGSLLREKIVAQASAVEAIVVDESKLVERLGSKMPLPLEVIPFGWMSHLEPLKSLGGQPVLRLRADGSPFITDEGNFTLDVTFADPAVWAEPRALDTQLRRRAGVVETGLFLGLTSVLVVARSSGVETLHRR
ncbi:MAG: ribose-5-phosphate isomerase RpiA [Candidatus Eisenbacteria bacterium]|nr:ribose-5-phosphate isomerase RpiA [Candidatus Eisenbacteria bacterium]MCC7140842.1 ribose-5-phosphate isomerase RpiA [Candidatus Eisenbacteria bacterium]